MTAARKTAARLPVASPVDVRVREYCGAYVTATVAGQRCSCTNSATFAALGLARKLWPGTAPLYANRLPAKGMKAGESKWRIGTSPPASPAPEAP